MDAPEIILVPSSEDNTSEGRKYLKRELEPIADLAANPNLYRARSIAKSVLGAVPGVGWLVRGGPPPGAEVVIGAGASAIGWMPVLVAVGPALGTALGAWLQSKNGRKIRIKYGPNGEFEAEARDIKELETALQAIKKHQSSRVILEP